MFLIYPVTFFLEVLMGKFKKATKNDIQKFFIDQLKYTTYCIDRRRREALKA